MKSGELNSAECYEQSQCQTAENQKLADDLDKLDLIIFQISNALRAARIRIQREDGKIDIDYHELEELTEKLQGILLSARIINESVKNQVVADYKVDPTEYVRNS